MTGKAVEENSSTALFFDLFFFHDSKRLPSDTLKMEKINGIHKSSGSMGTLFLTQLHL
jgi:hypothetical protein